MTVVPRWEWRTFGASLDDAERRLAQLEPARVEESADRYVLSAASDASVKVRGGLLDVKLLQRVDGGLEQWKPIAKLPFPLTADGVRIVLDALGVEARAPVSGDELDGLLAELVEPRDDLAVVVVRKRRTHYMVGGCMAELSDIVTEHGATRTIALEFEDPVRVLAAVRELGLDGRPNVSLPREAQGDGRLGRTALRGGRRGDQLGEVPCRRAARGRRVATAGGPGRRHPARRGPRHERAARGGADAAHCRGHRRHGG